ncbi:Hypothetical predicted protein, partial [Paramuricea clavata]
MVRIRTEWWQISELRFICSFQQDFLYAVNMHRLQQDAYKIFRAGVQAVSPCKLIPNALKVSRDKLLIQDIEYHLNQNVHVVAFGKAVLGMVQAVEDILGSHIVQGVASVPCGTHVVATCETRNLGRFQATKQINSTDSDTTTDQKQGNAYTNTNKIEIIEGAKNNYPDEDAQSAAMKIMKIAESVEKNDILLVLVSGGGSALLPLPVSEITLQEKLQTTKILSKKGATIVELNTVRKHLSRIKGGKLAQTAYPASDIHQALESRNQVDAVYLDFAKAFDKTSDLPDCEVHSKLGYVSQNSHNIQGTTTGYR